MRAAVRASHCDTVVFPSPGATNVTISAQLTVDVEVAQPRAKHPEDLGLREGKLGREPMRVSAARGRCQCLVLRHRREHGEPVHLLELADVPDAPIQPLEQEGQADAQEQPRRRPSTALRMVFGDDGDAGVIADCTSSALPV